MEKKTKHFDMRLSESENEALTQIAEQKRVTKTKVLLDYVKRTAKRMGIPI